MAAESDGSGRSGRHFCRRVVPPLADDPETGRMVFECWVDGVAGTVLRYGAV